MINFIYFILISMDAIMPIMQSFFILDQILINSFYFTEINETNKSSFVCNAYSYFLSPGIN